MNSHSSIEYRRAGLFTALVALIGIVGDGWSQRHTGLLHQFLILPFTILFAITLSLLLFAQPSASPAPPWTPRRALVVAILFELAFIALFLHECKRFAFLGYTLHPVVAAIFFLAVLLALGYLAFLPAAKPIWIFAVSFAAYIGGLLIAIFSFPLTYLRSDMMPVILWADTNLLHHIDPYTTMHVGDRIYDFPYLPGMIVAFLPFTAAHLDIRFGTIAYVAASAALIYWAARADRRREVAALLAIFLVCPYLQYRHELYLSPHWLTLVAVFVLMQRKHFAWAAFICGISMGIYQFSWIVVPFVLLNGFRRRGWLEAAKLAFLAIIGALLITGPFLASAMHRIANNAVGQWGQSVAHATAEPMNLSYWVTYLIHPDKLLRLQAALMIVIFLYCFAKKRCATLEDTLRWINVALTLFIMLNVLVDGYFYLMLLVPLLIYTCIANGWWSEPHPATTRHI